MKVYSTEYTLQHIVYQFTKNYVASVKAALVLGLF